MNVGPVRARRGVSLADPPEHRRSRRRNDSPQDLSLTDEQRSGMRCCYCTVWLQDDGRRFIDSRPSGDKSAGAWVAVLLYACDPNCLTPTEDPAMSTPVPRPPDPSPIPVAKRDTGKSRTSGREN